MKLSVPQIAFHPFFFGAFPICSLLACNLDKAGISQLFLPLSVVLGSVALLYLCIWLISKKTQKAALITSLLSLSFLSYGHCIIAFMAYISSAIQPLVFLAVYFSLVVLFTVLICKYVKEEKLADFTFILNTVSMCLLVTSAMPIFTFSIHRYDLSERWHVPSDAYPVQGSELVASEKPDVYYIILDGFERADILKKNFGVDDSAFVNFLESKGFYVASQSHSNYAYTALSLSSSLNMQYINWLSKQVGEANKDWTPLFDMILTSEVMQAFKKQGYRYVHFDSAFFATGNNPLADELKHVNWISPLITACVQLTPIGIHKQYFHPVHDELRKQRLTTLRTLAEVAEEPGPKVIFVHIVMPHMPFLFDENGNEVNGSLNSYMEEWADRKGYSGQLRFLEKKMTGVVEAILQKSKTPPIIIIQGDHGAGASCEFESKKPSAVFLKERMSIMNAYLLPGAGRDKLYSSITPVNSFRLVLNHYLHYSIPLLEDRVYFSPFDRPYAFTDVSKEVSQ